MTRFVYDVINNRTPFFFLLTHLGTLEKWKNLDCNTIEAQTSPDLKTNIMQTLIRRNTEFLQITAEWVDDASDNERNPDVSDEVKSKKLWRADYNDNNAMRLIIKVDSHQLNEHGTGIKRTKPRYSQLIPCYTPLHANHIADTVTTAQSNDKTLPATYANNPPCDLWFNFVWNGRTIDKDISYFIRTQLEQERFPRLQMRETQGLAWCFLPFTHHKFKHMIDKSSWRRCIMGLTSTHTRSTYKNDNYRKGIQMYRLIAENLEVNIDNNLTVLKNKS